MTTWIDKLVEDGFAVIPGPIPAARMERLREAYDTTMAAARPPELAIGRTSTRVQGLVNYGAEFDELYVHQSLLEAARRVIDRPFKLSSLLARTVPPGALAQALHVDFELKPSGFPMVGFILMVDGFRADNGATRFVAGSHLRPDGKGEWPVCGPPGTVIVYNGSVRHGHGANATSEGRRSVQGAFIRRDATGWIDQAKVCEATRHRIGPLGQYLLMI